MLSFPPMRKGLDKTLVVPIFGAKECTRMQDFVLKVYKNISGGRNARTPAAGGETFVRTHPPNAGAPPLLIGLLRPWSRVKGSDPVPIWVWGSTVGSSAGMGWIPDRPKVFHYFQHSGWPFLTL